MGGSESGRIVGARRTQRDEQFGGGRGRPCFLARREQERQIGHGPFLDDDGENAQGDIMFLGMRELGVVAVIGVVALRKMGVDDGAVRVFGRAVVVIVVGLGGVEMQEWRGKECQEDGQAGVRRERSPHGSIVDWRRRSGQVKSVPQSRLDASPLVRLYSVCWLAQRRRPHVSLTKRQKEVLDFLVGFVNKHGYSPSFEEIGRALRLTSLATVHKHITTLERKGFVRRGYNRSRSIEVVQLPKPVREQVLERHTVELPLLGRIAAGRPLEAIEDRETFSLGQFTRGQNNYVLRVKGNSMIDDHILDGDFIVVEQTQVANPGEVVVALVDGDEATLKRFYRESGGKIRLQPANSDMQPIVLPAGQVKIQGRVVGVLRKY